MRLADRVAAWLVCLLGAAHLAVGSAVFAAPTQRRVWFASAGFLLIVTGLANLAAQSGATRLQSLAGGVGSVSILIIGTLLAMAEPGLLTEPQTPILLAFGALLTACRVRELFIRSGK